MTKDERELLDAWRLNGYFQGDGGIVMDKALTRKVDLLIDRLARVEEAAKAVADVFEKTLAGDERRGDALGTLRSALDGKEEPK